ncbi:acyl carrier protein [Albimonas sp. CAU 1670]|uniref:acyl carrier protein n=1 Tax=Albimonas sp. CAU 1670 TaxID=3032599 RepID=UPI0023DB7C6E|nr:acyl carrier protein [Albimonas sp. CAU 1670]MDF2235336.1 acyl carrier protein [Albimonas sp. CAU 1670]
MATFQEVVDLIADQLGADPSEVTPDARIAEDLGAESADVANIVAAVEDRMGIVVPEDRIAEIATVNDLFLALQKA